MATKNSLKDALAIMTGKDLDEAPKKKAKTKKAKPVEAETEVKDTSGTEKPAKKAKEPERKPLATDEAKFAAFRYANKAEQLSNDVQEALEKGSLSPDLEKLLQVLFDKAAVRELVSAQGGVRAPEPEPEKYHLDFCFKNTETGDDCTTAAEQLLAGGMKLEDLGNFNMKLYVSRKRESDDTEICEGNEADYEEMKQRLLELANKVNAKDGAA